jgi:hypothetical protein
MWSFACVSHKPNRSANKAHSHKRHLTLFEMMLKKNKAHQQSKMMLVSRADRTSSPAEGKKHTQSLIKVSSASSPTIERETGQREGIT